MTYTSNSVDIVKVQDGQVGQSLYTWIAYADDDQGTGFTTESSAGKKYIGLAFNKKEQTESQDYRDYAWSKIQGEDGKPGAGVERVIITYQISDSQTVPPGDEPAWSDTPLETTLDKPFLWTKTVFVYSEEKRDTTYSVSKASVSVKIETDQEEILKFYTDKSNPDRLTFSPSTMGFRVLQLSQQKNFYLEDFTYSFKIVYVDNGWTKKERTFTTAYDFLNEETEVGTGKRVDFNIATFLETQFEADEDKEAQKYFKESNSIIEFTLLHNDNVLLTKNIFCRFGNTNDMAKFSINAADISASIQNAGLRFSAEGLQLLNTSFSILKDGDPTGGPQVDINGKKYSKVLYADDNGNLTFTGSLKGANGDFTGTISATDGTFLKGTLGTLKVSDQLSLADKIFISAKDGIRSSTNRENADEGFSIGLDGKIYANELILGTSATIKDYIQLGKARLNNPSSKNNFSFIECKNAEGQNTLSINQSGIISLGAKEDILIDGVNSRIIGKQWSITPDMATFSNAHISGTLSTTIFEKNSTRLSGGSFVFKNAVKITSIDESKTIVYIDGVGEDYCSAGEVILIKTSDGMPIYEKVKGFVKNGIQLETPLKDFSLSGKEPPLLIFLGKVGTAESKKELEQWVIGVNAESSTDAFGTTPNTITFSSLSEDEDGQIKTKPEVIIGQVPTSITRGEKVVGLYATSAYLTGSLTNIYEEDGVTKYAGINTESNVRFTKAPPGIEGGIIPDTSRIVIWTGATAHRDEQTGELKKDITQAKFQVTSDGTLYANQAIFEGSVLTKAQIQAEKLYGTDFYPMKDDAEKGLLRLHDTINGVVFYSGEENTQGLTISKDALFFGKNTDSNKKEVFTYKDKVLTTFSDISQVKKAQTIGGEKYYLSVSEEQEKEYISVGLFARSTEANDKKMEIKIAERDITLLSNEEVRLILEKDTLDLRMKNMKLQGDIIQRGQKVKEQRMTKDGKTIGYNVYVED